MRANEEFTTRRALRRALADAPEAAEGAVDDVQTKVAATPSAMRIALK